MQNIIQALKVTKRYDGQSVLNDVSINIRKQELLGILGPNGAGKSTLISIILGLTEPDIGEVFFNGVRQSPPTLEYKSSLAVVFQDSILDKELTVKENLLIRAYFYSRDRKKSRTRVSEVVKAVDAEELLSKRYGVLSGGERRRVDIARALLGQPKILFLDEPTTGLDILSRYDLWKLLKQLKEKFGLTIVLTTHYMEEAAQANRIIMLNEGSVIADDDPNILKENLHCQTLENVFLKLLKKEGTLV